MSAASSENIRARSQWVSAWLTCSTEVRILAELKHPNILEFVEYAPAALRPTSHASDVAGRSRTTRRRH